jgi:hypothetical protein
MGELQIFDASTPGQAAPRGTLDTSCGFAKGLFFLGSHLIVDCLEDGGK